ncbi:MAG: alpha/beta hydrolase [Proteobacteria bacterium]|nr:alpha/beta hydrolase [Pseudomonadota bacterium]
MEKRININNETGKLEAILDENSSRKGVVITHPHPLYGGDMENAVVHTIASVFKSMDYTTLRFNFRGVGGSTGSYSEGRGEQADVESAMNYLKELGIETIDLAGYSFGTWVIQQLIKNKLLPNRLILVSPPIDFMQFDESLRMDNLDIVVAGSNDDFASATRLESVVKKWNVNTHYQVIPGADHFYSGHFSHLADALSKHL